MSDTPVKDDISVDTEPIIADADASPINGASPGTGHHAPNRDAAAADARADIPPVANSALDPTSISDPTSARAALSRLAALPRARTTPASVAKSLLPKMPRGKKADKMLVIIAASMLAAAAVIIAIGALSSLPGEPLPPAQSGAGGPGINITGGGSLSEGGGINITGGGVLSEGGAVGPPLVTESATFSTDHIHLVDPAGGPATNTPTPTATPDPNDNADDQ